VDLRTGGVPDISEDYGGTLRLEPAPRLLAEKADAARDERADLVIDLPERFSLSGALPGAEDQARRGTCSTFATLAAAQFLSGRDLSEQHAYHLAWRLENTGDATSEATSVEAVLRALEQGVCDAPVWPYHPEPLPGNVPQGPPPPSVDTAEKYRIGSWSKLALPGKDAARYVATRLFAFQSPVILAVPTFWRGLSGWEDGFYIDIPAQEQPLDGWHAVIAVGYDLPSRFIVIQNSWGVDWGVAGMGLVSFRYLDRYLRAAYQIGA
jgi:hypothetical protein